MDDAALDEADRLLAGARETAHAPDCPEIVSMVLDEQRAELRQRRAEILEAAGMVVDS